MKVSAAVACLLAALVRAEASQPDRLMLSGSGSNPKTVELFVAAPQTPGPRPVILFVHGHQGPSRPGARVFAHLNQNLAFGTVDEGRLEKMSERGFLAASVSLPGYGGTSGPADFCGPRSQAAVQMALDYLLAQKDADAHKVVVYGVSRGAATVAMEATRDRRITGLILVSGIYDLGAALPQLDPAILQNIRDEASTAPAALAARSVLPKASMIHAHALILHGAEDGMIHQATLLAARLAANGNSVRLHVFARTPHKIPIEAQWKEVDPFLETIGQ